MPAWLAWLLVASVLLVGQAGRQHRIAHAGWTQSTATTAVGTGERDTPSLALHHNCALFDVATVGIGLQPTVFCPSLQDTIFDTPVFTAPRTPDLALARAFSSRAPPVPLAHA
jgi:hypothetical protein